MCIPGACINISVAGLILPSLLTQAFHLMDRDGDQMLSLQDLKKACMEVGLKLSEVELQVCTYTKYKIITL